MLVDLALEVVELAQHVPARVLNRLIVHLRPQSGDEEVQELIRPEGAQFLVEFLEIEALESLPEGLAAGFLKFDGRASAAGVVAREPELVMISPK